MAATWTWVVADAQGSALAELSTAAGRQITFKRNTYTEAQCTISHEDDAAGLIWDAIRNTGMPTLRCYRRGGSAPAGDPAILRLNGYLAPFQEDSETESTMSLVFRSPFARVLGDGSAAGRFLFLVDGAGVPTGEPVQYTATDAGLIAKGILDTTNAESPTGLLPGTIAMSKVRDRTYPPGANIGAAITDLAGLLDGFEFTERFVEGGPTLAMLDIAATAGGDRPGVRFEYGADTLANVRAVSRTTTPPTNFVYVVGGNGLYGVASDATSIATYGRWPSVVTDSDTIEQQVLTDKANALLRPKPTRVVGFSPDPVLAPLPWDDYLVGDTVRFFARRGALSEDVAVKVNSLTVVIDDEGNEAFEIPDPTSPDEEATIRSGLAVEVIDG